MVWTVNGSYLGRYMDDMNHISYIDLKQGIGL